jgi:hypothetical protein
LYYFAYGSNMLLARIRQPDRAPSARVVAIVKLPGHVLRFHKRSRDGSAKCDAYETGSSHDGVHGVVFELDAAGKAALDRVEGVGRGYREKEVRVTAGEQGWTARTYVAEADHIDRSLRPYAWYRELVLAGAREHALPAAYVERIAAEESVEDPEPRRAARERRAL